MFKRTNYNVNIDHFIATVKKKYGDSCTAPILSCTIGTKVCGGCRTPVLAFRAFTHPYCDDTLRTRYEAPTGIVRVDINKDPLAWHYNQGVQDIHIALPPTVQSVEAKFRSWTPKYPQQPCELPFVDVSHIVKDIQEYSSPTQPNSWCDRLQPGMHIEYRQINWKLLPCLVFNGFTGREQYKDTLRIHYAQETCTVAINSNDRAWPPLGGPYENVLPLRPETRVVKGRHQYWEPIFRAPKITPKKEIRKQTKRKRTCF